MEDDEADFPLLADARAYLSHRNYAAALEIYTDVLPTISQESITYTHVLLEYALCLLENVTFEVEMSYRRVLQLHQKSKQEDIDEDLEICWESLETCRLNLEIVNDRDRLCRVHKGLGDVHCLNNRFEAAVREYLGAMEYSSDGAASAEILESVAECYKNMEQYEEAEDYYRQLSGYYAKNGNQEMVSEIQALVEGMGFLKAQPLVLRKSKEKEDETDAPVNINHLRRK